MSYTEATDDFDQQLDLQLRDRPEAALPPDFAARMTAQLTASSRHAAKARVSIAWISPVIAGFGLIAVVVSGFLRLHGLLADADFWSINSIGSSSNSSDVSTLFVVATLALAVTIIGLATQLPADWIPIDR